MTAATSPRYPVNLVVEGRRCLLVGAGRIAARKAEGLLACGALVRVVAPEVAPWFEQRAADDPALTIERRAYQPADLAGAWLVFVATGAPGVAAEVFRDALDAGVWVNAADDPAHCTFTLPSVVRRGDLTVAVGTGGRSPALAAYLRQQLEAEIGPEYETLLGLLDAARRERQAAGTPTEQLDWQAALGSGMLEMVRSGHIAEAEEHLRSCL